MYYHRTLEDGIGRASRQFPVLLVTGPRQAGKTTLLQHLCGKGRRYITLDDHTLRSLAGEDPALFLQRFPPPLLIDEIQYAPKLLSYIKMEVDSSGKPGAFWLTGSQHFHMMKGVTESLAGRVAIINLLGFSMSERGKRASARSPFLPVGRILRPQCAKARKTSLKAIFKDIWTGALPGLIAGPVRDRELFYSSYLQTYLQRDVRDLTRVGDEQAFLRFLKASAARTGQMLNLTELARDADVSVPTAKSWLSILIASFQIALLQPYYTNITKRLVKRPKLYFLDTGLSTYLTEWSSPATLSAGAMRGPILETHVFSEILKSWWHRLQTPPLYYYRDKDGREIDFLFAMDDKLYPVEVKFGATPKREWAKHFSTLERLKKTTGEGAVVCLCKDLVPLTAKTSAVPVGAI